MAEKQVVQATAKAAPARAMIETEELVKEFKTHSVAEFFKKNRQMLGFSGKIRSMTTIVHEYVTNSLDACESANILPEVKLKIEQLGQDHYKVSVEDNGPGMPEEIAAKAVGQLLAGTKFHRLVQSRGQQGIGASGCTMYAVMTTGKPSHIKTCTTKGECTEMDVIVDVKNNKPVTENVKKSVDKNWHGTIVSAEFKDVQFVESSKGPLEYVRRIAIANPHASFTVKTPDGRTIKFSRTSNHIPLKAEPILPHPKGTTTDELMEIARKTDARKVSSMLKNEFSRMGDKKIEEIQEWVNKHGKVKFDLNIAPDAMTWQEAEQIVGAIKNTDFMAPQTDTLRPIGIDRIEKSLKSIVSPEFVAVSERPPKVYREGIPFQVEAVIAYGGGAGRDAGKAEKDDESQEGVAPHTLGEGGTRKGLELMRFANKTPLMFDEGGCATSAAVKTVDWKRYGIKDVDNEPVTVFVNVSSVYIPYTSAGKQAISDEEEVLTEIRYALMDAGRRIDRFVRGKARAHERALKKKRLEAYLPETAKAIAGMSGEKESVVLKKMTEIIERKFEEIDLEAEEEAAEEEGGGDAE
ncbi:MAG TPA: DNA topoisomerase VI subunit B [archaeon]|nr:DNA topoisomerase VI subunit B [archaeon]